MELIALIMAGVALAVTLLDKLAAKTENKLDDAAVALLKDPAVQAAIKSMIEKKL